MDDDDTRDHVLETDPEFVVVGVDINSFHRRDN